MGLRRISALALAGALGAAAPAPAAVYVVTKTADTLDDVCDADCSLRDAVRAANFTPAVADVIQVPAGWYTLSLPGSGEDQAATGDLDVRRETVIEGAGMDLTVIDAAGLDRVFQAPLSGPVELRDLTLRGGRLANDRGCGIAATAALVLTRVRVTDNRCVGGSPTADDGGGIYADSNSDLDVYASVVNGNHAERGAGIYSQAPVTWIFDSTIAGNRARVSGGGIAASIGEWLISHTTISGNRSGGATFFHASGQAHFFSSTISGNDGFAVRASGSIAFDNSTIARNRVVTHALDEVGTASFELRNTIVANQLSPSADECDPEAAVASLGYNLVSDGSCGSGTGDVVTADAELAPLLWNGGPTRTHHPLSGSPVIDAGGNPGGCTDGGGFLVTTDQRGFARTVDGDGAGGARCDIGSVEYAPEPAAGMLGAAGLAVLALARRRRVR
jgi:CSLREA domain-containing protein/MYXO-CTERM domain-containing protein